MELCKVLNRILGTTVGPWDLAALPDVYIEMVLEGERLRVALAEAGFGN